MSVQNPETIEEMKADPMHCSDCGRVHVLDFADPMPGLPVGLYFIPGYKHCSCGTNLFGFLTNLPEAQAGYLARGFVEMLEKAGPPLKAKRYGKRH